jgi:hypothetical protein
MCSDGATALTELLDRLNSHARGDESCMPLTPAQARAMYLAASDVVDRLLDEASVPESPAELLDGTGRMLATALRGATAEARQARQHAVTGRHRKHA